MKEMNIVLLAPENYEAFELLKEYFDGVNQDISYYYQYLGRIIITADSNISLIDPSSDIKSLCLYKVSGRFLCMYSNKCSGEPNGYFYLDSMPLEPQRIEVYAPRELGRMEHSPDTRYATGYWSIDFSIKEPLEYLFWVPHDDVRYKSYISREYKSFTCREHLRRGRAAMKARVRDLVMQRIKKIDVWSTVMGETVERLTDDLKVTLTDIKGSAKVLDFIIAIFWDKEGRLLVLDDIQGLFELGEYKPE